MNDSKHIDVWQSASFIHMKEATNMRIPFLHCLLLVLFRNKATVKSSIAMSLLLLAGILFAEARKETLKIEKAGVRFKVHWWDDGRDVPYQIHFKKDGVEAKHKFSSDGRLYQLKVGSTTYTFTWDSLDFGEGSPSIKVADSGEDRMLVGQDEGEGVEDTDADIIFNQRRLYACDDCENAFETLCGQGLDDVCLLLGSYIPGLGQRRSCVCLLRKRCVRSSAKRARHPLRRRAKRTAKMVSECGRVFFGRVVVSIVAS